MQEGSQFIDANARVFGDALANCLIIGSQETLAATQEAVRQSKTMNCVSYAVDYSRTNTDIGKALTEFASDHNLSADNTLVILSDYAGRLFHRLKNAVNPLRQNGFVVTRAFGRVVFDKTDQQRFRPAIPQPEAFGTIASYVHYQIAHGLAGVDAGYFEFGVFEGKSVSLAYHTMGQFAPDMTFCAFDSFEGIIGATDAEDFSDNTFFCNERTFRHNCRLAGIPDERLAIWRGNFLTDLVPNAEYSGIPDTCIVAHIDCDVYAPTLAALRYLTPKLVQGSVLVFDDFNAQAASNHTGERGALKAWLAENPALSVEPWFTYGGMSAVFFVHIDAETQ